MLISHPDKTLSDHLKRCDEISAKALSLKYIPVAFSSWEALDQWRKWLVYFHDFGKGTDFFQAKIVEAIEREQEEKPQVAELAKELQAYLDDFKGNRFTHAKRALEEEPKLGTHARLGAYAFAAFHGPEEDIILLILMKIIRRHHGYLTNFLIGTNNIDEYEIPKGEKVLIEQHEYHNFELYADLLKANGLETAKMDWKSALSFFSNRLNYEDAAETLEEADTYRFFFLQHFLFSLLLSADKGDVMLAKTTDYQALVKQNMLLPEQLVTDYKKAIFGEPSAPDGINADREHAFRLVAQNAKEKADRHLFSITLPTGMGKTLAAYHAAIVLQRETAQRTGKVPRIVYCLPFTSIIDQNAVVLSRIFENGGLPKDLVAKHHYLADSHRTYGEERLNWDEAEYLTAGWEQDVVITTFVQLLESIFTNQNRALRKFHNMANAIILLDEVQNIPPKYHNAIRDTFRAMGEYFDTRFVFITATQPIIFPSGEVTELTDESKEEARQFFTKLHRIELDQSRLTQGKQPISHWLDLFQEDIDGHPDKSFLFITNTIAQSQEIYRTLCEQNEGIPHTYLSSSILPAFRPHLIDQIKACKGPQLVVSTQVVEAGVDIDLDVVWRDFAPMDSINQSAGRCNRNAQKAKGVVRLYHSGKSFIYDSTLLDITQKVLAKFPEIIPENEFYAINEQYFTEVRKWVADYSDKSDSLRHAMKNLQLETLHEEFKLIDNRLDHLYSNVFIEFNLEDLEDTELALDIPENEMPAAVKQRYFDTIKADYSDPFEKKRQLKDLQPLLSRYVTRIPNKHYQPSDKKQLGNILIFEENWRDFYDLREGFKTDDAQVFII